MTSLLVLSALAALAISATVASVLRDGYRRSATRRPLREYERDEPYRAWTGR